MNLTIPTDNLYKFMALSGLTLFILFFSIPEYVKYKLDIEDIKLSGEIKILAVTIDLNTNNIAMVKKSVAKANKTGEKITKEIINLHNKTIQLNISNQKAVEQQRTKQQIIEYKKELNQRFKNIQLIGSIFGGLLSLIGFSLWYFIVQCRIDANKS